MHRRLATLSSTVLFLFSFSEVIGMFWRVISTTNFFRGLYAIWVSAKLRILILVFLVKYLTMAS